MGKIKNNQLKLTAGLFAVYFFILIWIILFKMQYSFHTLPSFRGLNLIPFAGSVVKNNQLDYNEIILNMIVFVPFGKRPPQSQASAYYLKYCNFYLQSEAPI